MTSRSRSKIQLTTYVDRVYPELASFFKGNLHLKVSYDLLKHYPLPSNISKARIDTLTNLLSTASHGRYKVDKAISLKNLSKSSIGINSSSVGLNPKIVQSGQFSASTTRMSKCGNRMLRYALIYSAHNVVKNNQTFKDYYTLKRSQGKSHYNALGHCATKLIRIIYKLLNENKKFDLA